MLTNIKRAAYLLICLTVLFSVIPTREASAAENYTVTVNGTALVWEETAASMRLGRLTVPLGSFSKALGAELTWDENKREALVFWMGRYARVQESNGTLYYGTYIQGYENLLTEVFELELPAVPITVNGRLTVPLASVAEAFGGTVEWNAETTTAAVTVPTPVMPAAEFADFPAEALPEQSEAEPEYYEELSLEDVLARYENDDPFVLVTYGGDSETEALEELKSIAAEMRIKIYGLAIEKEDAVRELPFASDGEYDVCVYLIHGHENVEALENPDESQIADALEDYLDV